MRSESQSFGTSSVKRFTPQNFLPVEIGKALSPRLFESPDPAIDSVFAIDLAPGFYNAIDRDICLDSMKFHVLHEFPVFPVVRLEQGILTAIEFEGRNIVPLAEFKVEGRGYFHPFFFKIEFDKTVIDEKVGSDEVNELPCGEVISDGCKADA